MSNRLYLWGDNSISQIGNTNLGTQNSPLLIVPSINVVAAGGYHTIGTSGVARTYVGCGDNSQNQLTNSGADAGVGAKTPFRSLSNNLPANIIQVEAGLQHSLYLTSNGTVAARGNNTYLQGNEASVTVNSYGPYIQISAGNYHNIALNTVGQAYIWGRNNYGQIGNAVTGSTGDVVVTGDIKYVAAGDYHTAIITGDNRLYLCGLNNRGQLGDNTQTLRTSFIIVGGTLANSIPLYWSKVSLGTQHSAAITTDGDLYTWGYNLYGQLGLGNTNSRSMPILVSRINGHAWTEVSAGNNYTLAINANGDVYGWGLNTNYQLGDGTNINRLSPVKINNNISGTPVAVKAGPGYHSAALFSDVAVTTTTTTTTLAPIGPNTANFNNCADWNGQNGNVTTVGSNGGPSAYGTYDQSGNVLEWSETIIDTPPARACRGGLWSDGGTQFSLSSFNRNSASTMYAGPDVGFRLSSSSSVFNPLGLPYFVTVGNINNSNDNNTGLSYGGVNYAYQISKYAVTNCEYVEFLNAVASTDTYSVYISNMSSSRGGIDRSGSSGSYVYTIKNNMGNKPVVFLTWLSAARYCNWLHNGKPNGIQNTATTEGGAYTLNGATSETNVVRNVNAKYSIPTENEWYKAAYYSPNKNGSGSPGYYTYATQSDTAPTCVSANTTGDGPVASSYVCGATNTTTTTTAAPTTTTTTTAAPTTTTTTVRPQIVGSCMSRGSFSKIQLRRATNAQFISANTILASGEPGYATDTRVIKVGDGYTPWSALLPVNISGTIDFPTLLASNNINISSVGNTYVIGATGLALSNHQHTLSDITGLSGILNNVQSSGNYAPLNHQHVLSDITDFNGNNYAPIGHQHVRSDIADFNDVYSTSIYNLGSLNYGNINIDWAVDKQIQTGSLSGTAAIMNKGNNWPSTNDISRDVLLDLSVAGSSTNVSWPIVTNWYSSPPNPLPVAKHLILLRAMGTSIYGHYLGSGVF